MSRILLPRPTLDLARAAFLEFLYRGKSVLVVGVGDGQMIDLLLARGAARVTGVDLDGAAVEAVRRRLGSRVELKVGGPAAAAGVRFDLVLVAAGEALFGQRDAVAAVRERLLPGGFLVAATANGDVPDGGAARGMSFFDLQDRLAAHFPAVTMLGQSPFTGSALAPFGDDEVDPVLDTALVPGEKPALYVAIAGPRRLTLPYGLVAVPAPAPAREQPAAARKEETRAPAAPAVDETKALRSAIAERDQRIQKLEAERAGSADLRSRLADRERRLQQVEEERGFQNALRATLADREKKLQQGEEERRVLVEELERRTGVGGQALSEVRERATAAENGLQTARLAALQHAEEMRIALSVLAERDAYIAELEHDGEAIERVRAEARQAHARGEQAETRERAARRRIAELEGTLIRLEHCGVAEVAEVARAARSQAGASPSQLAAPPVVAAPAPAPIVDAQVDAQVTELTRKLAEAEARCEKLKAKADDLQREAWGHLRGRSEAEAAAAEVREDTVRKLKDARKIANVELMRAMEEATKKAVQLKDELVRTERERKEALAGLVLLQDELVRTRAEAEARVAAATDGASALQAELSAARATLDARVREAAVAESARVLGSLEGRVVEAEAERARAVAERDEALSRLARATATDHAATSAAPPTEP